jgi:translation elongation factor EF-4
MDLRRERGITIKSHAFRWMEYTYKGAHLDLIDTPDTLIFHMKFLDLLLHVKVQMQRKVFKRKRFQIYT